MHHKRVDMDDEVIINKEILKAIGAETRIKILKALIQRQKTQTELAEELGLTTPTILEHVSYLEKTGLIEPITNHTESRWKYYQLTKNARRITEGKRISVTIILASASFAILTVLIFVYLSLPWHMQSLSTGGGGQNIQSSLQSLNSSLIGIIGVLILIMLIITLFIVGVAVGYSIRKRA